MSLDTLLISTDTFKTRTSLHTNVDPKIIRPDIKYAQDVYILPVMGTAQFARLQDGIDNNNLTADETTLIELYITDALIYYTLAEMGETLSFQFWNRGVQVKIGENNTQPTIQEIIDIRNRHRIRAEYYANRLKLYLRENQAIFPLINNPGNGVDTVLPEKSTFTMPLYLDGCDCIDMEIDYGKMTNQCKK
jgi:hypothetical protein